MHGCRIVVDVVLFVCRCRSLIVNVIFVSFCMIVCMLHVLVLVASMYMYSGTLP